jgi:hypothetical protein
MIVTDVGMGCGGRGSVVAQGDCRAGFPEGVLVSINRRVDERRFNAFAEMRSAAHGQSRIGEGRCVRQNRVVLAPVAGVKSAEVHEPNRVSMRLNPPMTVTRRIRRRGERAISRKTIAQEMPGVPVTCGDYRVLPTLRTRAMGAAGTRRFLHNSDASCREIVKAYPPSFRGDAQRRTTMCNCTSENLELNTSGFRVRASRAPE